MEENRNDTSSLDRLFDEAVKLNPPDGKKAKRISDAAVRKWDKLQKDMFTDPENWTDTGHVALVHKETTTLLGHFIEWTHKWVKGCRKLVKNEDVADIAQVEWVSGPGWLTSPDELAAVDITKAGVHDILADCFLAGMHLGAPAIMVRVYTEWGGIKRVDLTERTAFMSGDGSHSLWLPSGTNILPLLGLECKINIKEELGL